MESLQPPPGTTGKSRASQKSESGDVTAVLRMRLWAYGAQPGKLSELAWEEDKAIAELVQDTVQSGHGALAEKSRSGIMARFEEPLQALSVARSLQQRFLSFHRDAPDGQVVASIVIENKRLEAAPDEAAAGENLLVEAHCAQILVGEGICDLARTIPALISAPSLSGRRRKEVFRKRCMSCAGPMNRPTATCATPIGPLHRRFRPTGATPFGENLAGAAWASSMRHTTR